MGKHKYVWKPYFTKFCIDIIFEGECSAVSTFYSIVLTITVAEDGPQRSDKRGRHFTENSPHMWERRSLLLGGIPLLSLFLSPLSLCPDAIVSAPVNHDLCHLQEREREASSVCATLTKSQRRRQIVAWPVLSWVDWQLLFQFSQRPHLDCPHLLVKN